MDGGRREEVLLLLSLHVGHKQTAHARMTRESNVVVSVKRSVKTRVERGFVLVGARALVGGLVPRSGVRGEGGWIEWRYESTTTR